MDLLVITDVSNPSFLKENGASIGDVVMALNDAPVYDNEQLSRQLTKIQASPSNPATIKIFSALGVLDIKYEGGKLGVVTEVKNESEIRIFEDYTLVESFKSLISDLDSKAKFGVSFSEIDAIILSTSPEVIGYTLVAHKGIVTAEAVIGINLLKDVLVNLRDIFGGRSATAQNVLKDLRNFALKELKKEAALLGANAVISVDLDYSELSNNDMLFLVASGTAVIVEKSR
jgi:uncharacterized protein YbjQ (UPF0145 family)